MTDAVEKIEGPALHISNGKPVANGSPAKDFSDGPSSRQGTVGKPSTNNKNHAHGAVGLTKLYANFVYSTSGQGLRPAVKDKLKELLLDYIGVTAAGATKADSSEPIFKAIISLGAANGSNTVLSKGQKFTAPYAALLNGTFGHSFDFDDTHLAGILHPGVTVISAALAEAETRKTSGEDLLVALAIGYEITCRLGVALGDAAYSRGFHSTATAGIFGAVAAISKLRELPEDIIEMAFGLAGSKAAGSMQYLDNGSWNKRLHPGFAAHDAFLCVALAEAGVIGATKILEGKHGFLNAYTPNKNIDFDALARSLGSEWVFLATALKPYPACRMTHGCIELAETLGERVRQRHEEVERITIALKPEMWNIVGVPVANKIHPQNIIDAQFSIYYQAAVSFLHGSNTGWSAYDYLHDQDVHDLVEKIDCVKNGAYRSMETEVRLRPRDGQNYTLFLPMPLGEESRPFSRDKVVAKYMSLAAPVYGEKLAIQISETISRLERHNVDDLMRMLQ